MFTAPITKALYSSIGHPFNRFISKNLAKIPGSKIANPGDVNVVSRKFYPDEAGIYSIVDGEISVNGGVWSTNVIYVINDYLQVRRDAHATDYSTSVEAIVNGPSAWSEVFTVITVPEPNTSFPYTFPFSLS